MFSLVSSISLALQLRDQKVRKMAELLEKTGSSYFPAFKTIFREVVSGAVHNIFLYK